jgi:demethylmenaquinone methyltransferase/2-methoxy-6-polyprenyl-1,4-benzoquinol methylase
MAPGDSLLAADANRRMFDRLAPRYDRLNALLSFGLDARWRRREVAALAPRDGEHYLDIGCGTGDVALAILRRAPGCRVTGLDPSGRMLALASAKATRAGLQERFAAAIGDVLRLPFSDGAFAGITSAFALRSFVDRTGAFREMRRALAQGGRISLLELTVPGNPLLRLGYRLHTRTLGALMARLVCGTGPYRFLCGSVDRFPKAPAIVAELAAAGFADARAQTLTGGVATLYLGRVS